jgi:hypothetical protein
MMIEISMSQLEAGTRVMNSSLHVAADCQHEPFTEVALPSGLSLSSLQLKVAHCVFKRLLK